QGQRKLAVLRSAPAIASIDVRSRALGSSPSSRTFCAWTSMAVSRLMSTPNRRKVHLAQFSIGGDGPSRGRETSLPLPTLALQGCELGRCGACLQPMSQHSQDRLQD